MFLLKEKCFYCRKKLEKGNSFKKDVKVPGRVGTFNKNFCNEEHAGIYEEEVNNRPKHNGGGCCH